MLCECQMYSVTQRTQQLEPPAHTHFYIHTRMLFSVCLQSTKQLLIKTKEKKDNYHHTRHSHAPAVEVEGWILVVIKQDSFNEVINSRIHFTVTPF